MKPAEYAICELDELGQIAYIFEYHSSLDRAMDRLEVYATAPPGNLHHIDGSGAVYRLVCSRPGAFTEATE
jgi:hypothetical protein